jgi:Holliday junction resolvase RusA-like endonuclease
VLVLPAPVLGHAAGSGLLLWALWLSGAEHEGGPWLARVACAQSVGVVKLTVPMPPPLSNASGRSRHWRTVYSAKVAYQDMLTTLSHARIIPPAPTPTPPAIRITSTMYLGNRMDVDNAMARHKWVLDWLAAAGFVENDRNVEWTGFPTQVVKRGQEYRIELEITPWPSDSPPPRAA